jgi:fructose transport system substrate-binding protein
MQTSTKRLAAVAIAAVTAAGLTALPAGAAKKAAAKPAAIKIGLITKTETNPFFVKMKEGAAAKAKELGATLISASGKADDDNASQVAAFENMVAAGVKTILLTASDSKAIVASVKKAQAKGVQVIALDSPLVPDNASDALFATNNYVAGQLIGKYAKAALGGKAAKIVALDLFPGHPVGAQRHNGFADGRVSKPFLPPATMFQPMVLVAPPTALVTPPRARPAWKTACPRFLMSTWCTPSMSQQHLALTRP